MKLTAIVLTRNEEKNIERCIKTLGFCDQVIVVDDGSTDSTVKIAKKMGATILQHPLNNDWSAQRNWVMEQIKSTWYFFVDADEIVTPELAQEIQKAVKTECVGIKIKRLDTMWNQTLRHGDVGNVWLLRLARRGAGQWVGKVHEVWDVQGQVCELKNPLLHYPHQTMVEFLQHINTYSSIRAQELRDEHQTSNLAQIIFYPISKFLYLWIWKLGFADGTVGFIHAMTMAFYSFLVRGKLWLALN